MGDVLGKVIKNVEVECEGKTVVVVLIKTEKGDITCRMEDELKFANPELERQWQEDRAKGSLT